MACVEVQKKTVIKALNYSSGFSVLLQQVDLILFFSTGSPPFLCVLAEFLYSEKFCLEGRV